MANFDETISTMKRRLQETCLKRRKSARYTAHSTIGGTEGRLSNLPDDICSLIISFLSKKDAVKTSTLSRRWRYLWATGPALDFDFAQFPVMKRRKVNFVDFVKRSLILHDALEIRRFRLSLNTHHSILREVSDWIAFAIRHYVEEIDLNLPKVTFKKLPDMIFTYGGLKMLKLNLQGSMFVVPRSLCLSGLRTLHLASVYFNDGNSLLELISSCSKLQNLTIEDCKLYNFLVLSICSDELLNLSIKRCQCALNFEIKLSAPSLVSFTYIGPLLKVFSLEKLISLTYASIEFDSYSCEKLEGHALRLDKILQGLNNARTLKLSATCMEFLSTIEDMSQGLPSQLPNLRHLKLSVWPNEFYIKAIGYLLGSCPNLETLSVEKVLFPSKWLPYKWTCRKGIANKLQPISELYHLKTVRMMNFEDENMLKLGLVKLLMRNARVIEKLITIRPDGQTKESTFGMML